MKEEKIFVTDNPMAEYSLRSDVLRAFERCGNLVALIKDFGLPVTKDIVKDCLTLRKEAIRVPVEGTTKYVGESAQAERFAREFALVEGWANCEHLEAAFNAMLGKVEEQGKRLADIKQRKETLKNDFDKLLGDIYGVFHVNRLVINTDTLLRYFDIENEKVILVPNFKERLKADTATYATKADAIKACKLHRSIAEQLNTLAHLMKKVNTLEFASELTNLFSVSDKGAIEAAPIDYDLFT